MDPDAHDNAWSLPILSFAGFHPDACILQQDGDLTAGPLGRYHSAIAYAAFRCGMDERQALDLFCAATYRALGYLDCWAGERDALLGAFRGAGFDIGPAFLAWIRRGTFMHVTNRPKIDCMMDVARALLARAGLAAAQADCVPADPHADGPVFPVYPEIAAPLGVRGSYLFKQEDRHALMDLEAYVHACFALYRACADIERTWPGFRRATDRAIDYLRTGR
jgi:hypothetical protein